MTYKVWDGTAWKLMRFVAPGRVDEFHQVEMQWCEDDDASKSSYRAPRIWQILRAPILWGPILTSLLEADAHGPVQQATVETYELREYGDAGCGDRVDRVARPRRIVRWYELKS